MIKIKGRVWKWNIYVLAGIAAAFIWSFVVIAFRQIQAYPSEHILIARIGCTLILCWILSGLFLRRQYKETINNFLHTKKRKKHFLYIILAGLMLGLNWFLFIYIVNHINIRSASLVYFISPITTTLLGFTVLKENFNKYKTYALILALISLAILGSNNNQNIILILLCAVSYSIFILMQKLIFPSNKIIIYSFYLTIIVPIIFIIEYQNLIDVLKSLDMHFIFYIIIISIFFTIIPMIMNLYAISKIPISTVGIIIYVNPICTFLISKIFYKEDMILIENIAYGLIILTIILFNWEELKKVFHFKNKANTSE